MSDRDRDLYQIYNNIINLYFSVVFIPVAIALNLAAAIVFFGPKLNNKTVIGFLYGFLCVYNIFALTNSILFTQFLPTLSITLTNYSTFNCLFLNVWEKFALQMPSMQQLLITFKIFADVCCPTRFVFLRLKKNLLIVMTVMMFLIFCANSIGYTNVYSVSNYNNNNNNYYNNNSTTNSNTTGSSNSTSNSTSTLTTSATSSRRTRSTTTTTTASSLTNWTNTTWSDNSTSTSSGQSVRYRCQAMNSSLSFASDLVNICLRDFVPFLLMTLISLKICYTLIKSKRKLASAAHNEQLRRTFTFTVSVIIMNVLFFLFFLPWSVSFIINYIYKFSTSTNQLRADSFQLFQTVATTIAFFNNVTPFFAYIIINKIFRAELYALCHRIVVLVLFGAVSSSKSAGKEQLFSPASVNSSKIAPAKTPPH